MRYLFWNTHRNNKINPILCDLIVENGFSIIILAEYFSDANNLIQLLSLRGLSMQQYPTTGCEGIYIFGKTGLDIDPNIQTDKSSIQIIDHDIVLCCVHLNSQIYSDNDEIREIHIEQLIRDIISVENEINTQKTIVVGDFNINPYDKSCISARYFHGLPVYKEAKRNSRTVAEKKFYMFYNPMWNFLGDFNEPYGTYYKNTSSTINTYWNIYDQVIIRPILRPYFIDESLKILTKTEKMSLLDEKGHPNLEISDHLPITFEIKEEKYG